MTDHHREQLLSQWMRMDTRLRDEIITERLHGMQSELQKTLFEAKTKYANLHLLGTETQGITGTGSVALAICDFLKPSRDDAALLQEYFTSIGNTENAQALTAYICVLDSETVASQAVESGQDSESRTNRQLNDGTGGSSGSGGGGSSRRSQA